MFKPSDSTAECGHLDVIIKQEKEACPLELVLIKEEKAVEESECEAAIKQELLLGVEPEPGKDIEVSHIFIGMHGRHLSLITSC